MKLIEDVLNEAREVLKNNNIDPKEARLLLAYAMNISLTDLMLKKECSKIEYEKFIEYVNRRVLHTPFAYIVGQKEFMNLTFKVNENVLIPREDTEILVLEAIKILKNDYNQGLTNVLDLCTGSGAIAISIAKNVENVNVVATDISIDALNVAKENAIKNNVIDKIEFINSDLFSNISKKDFSMIISNPPYIKTDVMKDLQEEVKKEPYIALDGGKDGLYFYKEISKRAKDFLKKNGIIMFEIGYDEVDDVSSILKFEGFSNVKVIKDYSNNDRVVLGYN